jgi:hypothetical protein
MKVEYKKLFRYFVLSNETKKTIIETNNFDVAERKAILKNGTLYEQTRHDALLRLQKMMYYKINYGTCELEQFDYPNLLTEIK